MQPFVRPRQLMASVMAATRPRPQTREEEIATFRPRRAVRGKRLGTQCPFAEGYNTGGPGKGM